MKELLKKYWYVGLVSIIFLAGIIAAIVNTSAGRVSSKSVDGKDVVFSINDQNKTADDLYADVKDQLEGPLAAILFEKEVISETYEFNEDEKTEAKLDADTTEQNFKAQMGAEKGQESIAQTLRAIGFEEDETLEDYFLFYNASEKVVEDYFKENYASEFESEQQPRLVSHILVQLPTEEGLTEVQKEAQAKEKMDEIDKALAQEGANFKDIAAQYSQDTGSASNQGSLGIVYKGINFHQEFLDATYKLSEGQVGEWVKSPSGYHKIKIDSTKLEDIQKDQGYQQLINQLYPQARGEAFFKLGESLNLDFSANPEFEQTLKQHYNLGE